MFPNSINRLWPHRYWKQTFEPYRLGLEGRLIHPDSAILGLAWSPTDTKFASASEDHSVRVWDVFTCSQHLQLDGHAGDCTSVDWHPSLSLLASGSRDTLVRTTAINNMLVMSWSLVAALCMQARIPRILCLSAVAQQCSTSSARLCVQIKLWDARSGTHVCTYHGHQERVNCVKFHWNGNWLLSGSKDTTCKLFELRMNRELQRFLGHNKEVSTLAWHPLQESLFVTGGTDDALMHWFVDSENAAAVSRDVHGGAVNDIAWHPLGHMLMSVGYDASIKFWTRGRPGDVLLGHLATSTHGPNQQVEAAPGNPAPAKDIAEAPIPGLAPKPPPPRPPPGPPPGPPRPPGGPPPGSGPGAGEQQQAQGAAGPAAAGVTAQQPARAASPAVQLPPGPPPLRPPQAQAGAFQPPAQPDATMLAAADGNNAAAAPPRKMGQQARGRMGQAARGRMGGSRMGAGAGEFSGRGADSGQGQGFSDGMGASGFGRGDLRGMGGRGRGGRYQDHDDDDGGGYRGSGYACFLQKLSK